MEMPLYIEPSSDGDLRSLNYAKELFLSPLDKKQDIIVDDVLGTLLPLFKQLEQELCPNAYELIELDAKDVLSEWLADETKADYEILEITQPRYRLYEAKAVFITHANRKICELVYKSFSENIRKGSAE